MKTLQDILLHLKRKYQDVRIYKMIKKHNLVVRIFETKGKRTLYYICAFDKKGNIIKFDNLSLKIISKTEITQRLKNFTSIIKDLEVKERAKRNVINNNGLFRYKVNGTKIKNKKKKEIQTIGLKYKGKKLDDLVYLWGLLRLTLTYADEAKDRFKLEKTPQGYLKMVITAENKNDDDRLIVELYAKLAILFRQLKIFDGTPEVEYLDRMFEKNYKLSAEKLKQKNKGKEVYYVDIYIVLYLLQLWKEEVKFKSFDIRLDYKIFYKIIEYIYEKYEDDENEVLGNSEHFVEDLYHLVYQKYNWFMRLH